MGCTAPPLHLANLALTVNAAISPSGQESPVVLFLHEPILYGWEWTEFLLTQKMLQLLRVGNC